MIVSQGPYYTKVVHQSFLGCTVGKTLPKVSFAKCSNKFFELANKDNLMLLIWCWINNPRLLVSIWMFDMLMEWLLFWIGLDIWRQFDLVCKFRMSYFEWSMPTVKSSGSSTCLRSQYVWFFCMQWLENCLLLMSSLFLVHHFYFFAYSSKKLRFQGFKWSET